jgi:hypothetical protein
MSLAYQATEYSDGAVIGSLASKVYKEDVLPIAKLPFGTLYTESMVVSVSM